MELRHLRYFIAVADELSFSRAAVRLQMAQPPLSQQIQALEAELGVKLFDRTKRPLQITLAGQALLKDARSTLIQLEQALLKTQRIHQGELGYLSVGFTSSIANGILPDILRTFRQKYPEVKLILREENCCLQIQGLRDRQTDIIFIYQNSDADCAPDLERISLLQEPLVVVLPQQHRLAKQAKIALIDLAGEDFVMPLYQMAAGLSEQIHYHCAQAGFVPQVAQEAIFMVTILGLVAGEIGVSILPSNVENLCRQGVVYRPIADQPAINELMVMWRRGDASLILQQFLNVVQATLA